MESETNLKTKNPGIPSHNLFLKSMEINGFKNFYNLVHIDFSPKLNLILGPEQSGKSNALEAITWVLFCYADSEKETDLILFYGNENHLAVDFAEVSLVFGNASNECSDIIIKRRLERTGNNYWFINKEQFSDFDSFRNSVKKLNLPEICLLEDFGKTHKSLSNSKFTEEIKNRIKEKQCIVETNRKKAIEADCLIGFYPDDENNMKAVSLFLHL